jgi:prepilin-type N-terminal cleavage/methylation domain-containing protein
LSLGKIYYTIKFIVGKSTLRASNKVQTMHIEEKKMERHHNCLSKRSARAFTLAEVLVTLIIVGIVSMMVVPQLLNDTKNAELATKLQKESAVVQQALKLLAVDSGGAILNNPNFSCSGNVVSCQTTSSANALNDFASRLNIAKNCGSGTGCWYSSPIKYLGGTQADPNLENLWNNNYGKAILADGTLITVFIYNGNCSGNFGSPPVDSPLYNSLCGTLTVDVNGKTGPNQYGRDVFEFWIARKGVYPMGIFNDGMTCSTLSNTYNSSWGCSGNIFKDSGMKY